MGKKKTIFPISAKRKLGKKMLISDADIGGISVVDICGVSVAGVGC